MFVDAIGTMKELPRNERATALYREHYLSLHPGVDPETQPHICGTAVLFDETVLFD
jgi:hypothetical protein